MLKRMNAGIAIAAYLAATFLPCEAPETLRLAVAISSLPQLSTDSVGVGVGVGVADGVGDAGPESMNEAGQIPASHSSHSRAMAHAGSPSHARVPGSRTHAASVDHAAHRSHSDHAIAPPAKSAGHYVASPESRQTSDSGTTVLRSQCSCGCGDTRSFVGGGAARLGTAVLIRAAPLLPEVQAVRALPVAVVAWRSASLPRDPIPI